MRVKLLFLFCFLPALAATAQTNVYVDSSVVTSGAGTSWGTAYKTLNEALNSANATTTTIQFDINIAKGTYYSTGIQNGMVRDSTFLIARGGIKLLGGYPNGGGVRNVAANPTVLSGNIGAASTNVDDNYHIMVMALLAPAADSIIVDGLNFIGGNANGTGTKDYNFLSLLRYHGGAIYDRYVSKCRINNCVFLKNKATNFGGAMYSMEGHPIMTGCSFSLDSAGNGAVMYNDESGPQITNCTFTSNYCPGDGGVVYTYRYSVLVAPSFTDCLFSGNKALGLGGVAYDRSVSTSSSFTTSRFRNCTFSNNTGFRGGALYCYNGNASGAGSYIKGCTFTGNLATYRGGAIYSNSDFPFNIDSCILNGNTATDDGGGIFNEIGAVSSIIQRCIFTGNKSATNGGGLYNQAQTGYTDCTFTLDSAAAGGGVYNTSGATFLKCSFTLNKAVNGGGMFNIATGANCLNNVFSGNIASARGGALYNRGCSPVLKSTLVSGNKATVSGGAIYDTLNSSPQITNCTFSGDTAANANGIYNTNSSPIVLNSIIWEGPGTGVYNFGSSNPSITYSIVQGGYTGTGNLSSDPAFLSPLSPASAPTTGGDYHVYPCSPAINAGLNSGSYLNQTDLAGNARLFGTTVDRGAYELQSVYLNPVTGAGNVCENATVQLSNTTTGGTWSTSNAAIATVSTTGLVTGISAGTVTISYSLASAPCTAVATKIITVNPAPPAGTITGPSSFCTGVATTLANTTPFGAWTSSTPSIATINSSGVVFGYSAGVDTITYTVFSGGCAGVATKLITLIAAPVVAPITGNSYACAGFTSQLSNATPGGVWSSSTPTNASVSATGLASAVLAGGSTTIAYTVTSAATGCSTAATVTFSVPFPPSITFIGGPATVCAGGTIAIGNGAEFGVWTSSNSAVATVAPASLSSAYVTGVATGTVTITYTITGSSGCVSTATKVITVTPAPTNAVSATICIGDNYLFGNQNLTTAGTYVKQFVGAGGCDSTVTLTLSVTTVDNSITKNGNVLTANQSGATYQWLDCLDLSSVPGATGQSFSPTTPGSYKVVVTKSGCSVVSICSNEYPNGVIAIQKGNFDVQIYPNPARELVVVNTEKIRPDAILVKDIMGKTVLHVTPSESKSTINLAHLSPGVYLVEVYIGRRKSTGRISVVR